jgi:L-threonylcarbamoyladenylate synthase
MPRVFNLNPHIPDDRLIKEAVNQLSSGSIIVYPTETFYGLGAVYDDETALERIFTVKNRDISKPVHLLIPDTAGLCRITDHVSEISLSVAHKFWPGPVTLLFPPSPNLSPLLIGSSGQIGCRISSHPVAQRFLNLLNKPVTSTSANISGGISPTTIDQIPESLLSSVDIILDAGETPGGNPSTIIDVTVPPFTVIREGAIPSEDIFYHIRKNPQT